MDASRAAKRRLVYGLLARALPLVSKQQDPERGLAFPFLADPDPVMTGPAQGLITLNIAEADEWVRERTCQEMSGDFRHESGHYYWEWLLC